MIQRRTMLTAIASMPMALASQRVLAAPLEVPDALKTAKDQFYNFLLDIVQGQGMTASQRVVLNSTIFPLDISAETPYFNEELFRLYADRTFLGGTEALQASTAVFQAARFSSQYRSVLNIAAAKIDQNHPEIQNSLVELQSQLSRATSALAAKNVEFETNWEKVATARKLDANSKDPKIAYDYQLQRITWFAQARYADQIQTYSDDLDRVDSLIDSVRRKVYSSAEMSVLDNLSVLSKAYNIARPWNANTERSAKAQGFPLSDTLLADSTKLPPAIYDSSPLVLPVGDLAAFLSGQGLRTFDTLTQSSQLDQGTKSWSASGGGSFFGISLGGGGSGSSSFSRSVSKLNSLEASFENISEYLVDRSAWFNPAVLQDPAVLKLVKGRQELGNLRYVCVSLIFVRGLKLKLRFSEKVTSSDWTQQSFNARGGASFFGFSVGGGGGSSSTNSTIKVDDTGTNVTFEDGASVARVIGARVEPLVADNAPTALLANKRVAGTPAGSKLLSDLRTGKLGYIDYQREKVNALNAK